MKATHGKCLAVAAAIVIVAVMSTARAAAQDLVTDRPDFTESSDVVGARAVQFESGFSYEWDGSGADRTRSMNVPGSLARIGVSDRIELRIGTDGYLSETQGGARTHGVADLDLGVKVKLLDEATHGFDFALIPMATFPTGSRAVRGAGVTPTLKLTWARSLPAGFSASGNYNLASLVDDAARELQQTVSLSIGHDLPLGFGSYAEVYGLTPMDRGTGPGWTVDGGLSHTFGPNLQLDVEVGRGVSQDAPDWFAGFGFAVRRLPASGGR